MNQLEKHIKKEFKTYIKRNLDTWSSFKKLEWNKNDVINFANFLKLDITAQIQKPTTPFWIWLTDKIQELQNKVDIINKLNNTQNEMS